MKDKLVTIKRFTYQEEIPVVKSIFDAEGIYYFVKNELTVQVHPFYSNAIGGIEFQVLQKDAERGIAILKEGGYINENDLQPSGFEVKLYEFLSKIPIIRNIYK